ncbi:MAG: GT2 family glycosyltransferase [Halioglobus sp.]
MPDSHSTHSPTKNASESRHNAIAPSLNELQLNVKIAVVIVNFNSADLLAKCLQHLLKQTRQADSVIIIDNASQDSSMADLPMIPGLEVHALGENSGFAAANNTAFERSSGMDYFITLNPDAFPAPDFIEQLEKAAESHPDYASFASRMMRDETTVDGAGDQIHISGLAWRHLHGRHYAIEEHTECDVFSACAGAAMYRAQDISELGGFDESFFCYMEDVDLGYRLQLRDRPCLYVPTAEVLHMGSAITGQYPGFAVYHGHRNLVWVMVKNTPAALLLLVLPAHLLMSIVLAGVYLARGQFRIYLKAKLDALRGLGQVWGKRKKEQEQASSGSAAMLRHFNFRLIR